jgi:hypothetical protein
MPSPARLLHINYPSSPTPPSATSHQLHPHQLHLITSPTPLSTERRRPPTLGLFRCRQINGHLWPLWRALRSHCHARVLACACGRYFLGPDAAGAASEVALAARAPAADRPHLVARADILCMVIWARAGARSMPIPACDAPLLAVVLDLVVINQGEAIRQRQSGGGNQAEAIRWRQSGGGNQVEAIRWRQSGRGNQVEAIRGWVSDCGNQVEAIRGWVSGCGN